MDKNNIEGVIVTKLSRMSTATYNEILKAVANEAVVPVQFESSTAAAKKIIVSRKVLSGGSVEVQNFGKIVPEDNPNFDEIFDVVKSGTTEGELYSFFSSCLLARICEKQPEKDFFHGYEIEEDLKQVVIDAVGETGYLDRVEALKEHGIEEGSLLFKEILKLVKKADEEIPKPKTFKNLSKTTESPIKKVLRNIVTGNNPILEGEKSLGKNVAWTYIAWILNAKIVPLQCHERLTQADMLGYLSSDNSIKRDLTEDNFNEKVSACQTGVWTSGAIAYQLALDKAQSPELKFTNGPVIEALERANKGYTTILLLDEMNLADGNLLSGTFNMLTDKSSDHIFVAGMGEVKIPTRESKLLIIGATQNPATGNYSGINTQNTATMSRFSLIEMPKVKNISPILKREADNYGVSQSVVNGFNQIYNTFKEMSIEEDGAGSDALNIRGFEAAIRLVGVGASVKDAICECVINTVGNYEDREVLRESLDDLLDKNGAFA
jgi:MoxR-like ATPase